MPNAENALKVMLFGGGGGGEDRERLDAIIHDVLEEGMGKDEREELFGSGLEGTPSEGRSSYDDFLATLESPSAADTVKGMMHFVKCFYEGTVGEVEGRMEMLRRKKIAPWQFEGEENNFAVNKEAAKAAKMLHAYLNLTVEAITNHPSFADQPPEVLGSVLEMFIMRKCHPRTWELSYDPDKDSAMKDRLDSLQWMNFEHLDIKCLSEATLRRGSSSGGGELEEEDGGGRPSIESNASTGSTKSISPPEDLWTVPLEALRQVDVVKSPVEKLEKIMLASSSITVALRAALEPGEMPGADDFLPALILAIVHANPPRFSSNLDYVQNFAQERQMMSEAGYVLTHMFSAVQFLQMLDASSLSISKEDYEAGIKTCKEEAERKRVEALAKLERNKSWGGATRGKEGGEEREVISDAIDPEMEKIIKLLEEKGCVPKKFRPVSARKVREMRQKGELTENLFQEYLANGGESGSGERKNGSMDKIPRPTYRFLAAEPSNIRVSDIPDLLAEYKGLVKTVEGLLNDRRVMEKEKRRLEMEKERTMLEKRREHEQEDSCE
ncbi:hypothetical protein TrCOL_g7709 [Triparma columacea]|uniref:VPS9 domain-containing protein n=1 Tax=Triparma columacea TaxID=722753 RepID=A0A9W7GPP2_9STRA|nr:hypothetical protein TrCOL_g7709 [Triparma columacea]